MHSLSQALYQRCYETLLNCSEFDSDSALRDVFVTDELAIFRTRLPESDSQDRRIRKTINYLVRQRMRGNRPVFPLFLAALRDGLPERDALRDELEELRIATEQELKAWAEANARNNDIGFSERIPSGLQSQDVKTMLDQARAQSGQRLLSHFKIDASAIIQCNLDQQKVCFVEGFKGRYKGALIFAVAGIDRAILKEYIIASMTQQLKQRTKRPTDINREVYLILDHIDFSSTEQIVCSIQQQIEEQLASTPITNLLSDNPEINLVIIVWYKDIPAQRLKEAALLYSERLKQQVAAALQAQGRCLVLFWATYGSPPIQPLETSIALPTFEKFEVESLEEWLETELTFQLKEQGVAEPMIKYCLKKLTAKVKYFGGRLPETYEVLKQSLELEPSGELV